MKAAEPIQIYASEGTSIYKCKTSMEIIKYNTGA